MTRTIFILALASCERAPAPMSPERASDLDTPWCVAAVIQLSGEEVDWNLCAGQEWACTYLHDQLAKHGAFVLSLGECEELL